MRVLYVDDDRVNAILFSEVCRLVPEVSLLLAGNAGEALDMIGEHGADLLVLDLHLPDGDGLALLSQLRQRIARDVPAYLCTAEDPEHVDARARRAGFAGCWNKPLDVARVVAALRTHAGSGGPSR